MAIRRPASRSVLVAVLPAVLPVVLAGCGGPASTMEASGPGAERNGTLFWGMVAISVFVFVVTMGLLAYGIARRRRFASDAEALAPITDDRGGIGLVVGGGVIFPVVVLVVLFVLTMVALRAQAAEDAARPRVTVEVIGHRWWWEVRYPDQGFTTANELHLPVGQPVRVEVTSADVIHSFWVPRLGRKMDAIPGKVNTLTLQADVAGTFRAECAEFCGIQHAKMDLLVVAEPQTEYDAWVADQSLPAAEPSTALERQGRRVFASSDCVQCHTIRGVSSQADVAPDLTHLASRLTIGAASVTNTIGNLGGWISNSQGIKPGNLMPPQDLTGRQLRALLAYLGALG